MDAVSLVLHGICAGKPCAGAQCRCHAHAGMGTTTSSLLSERKAMVVAGQCGLWWLGDHLSTQIIESWNGLHWKEPLKAI